MCIVQNNKYSHTIECEYLLFCTFFSHDILFKELNKKGVRKRLKFNGIFDNDQKQIYINLLINFIKNDFNFRTGILKSKYPELKKNFKTL